MTTKTEITLPKKLTRDTIRSLLKKAIKEHADGHPTVFATMIDYRQNNLSAVLAGRRQLPGMPTYRFCKLLGFEENYEALWRSQYKD